jgi:D-3-phosphoglycerate dehydrogenase
MQKSVLSMVDFDECPGALSPLQHVAHVVELRAAQEALVERIDAFDAFLTPLTVQTNREVLQRARRLRVIATPSTGTDHINMVEAAERGITVLSLRDDLEFLNTVTATAELAWALLLAVARRLPEAINAARGGHWGRDEFRGTQLSGKTLGIVGYGRLGRMVAGYGRAFGMTTLACDVKPMTMPNEIRQVPFDELLERADVVSIHVHLSQDTRHLFDASAFQRMKVGSILINTSRGAVVDENALLSALKMGQLAGAGLDVIDGEWRHDLADHPLISYARQHSNLLISPHVGGVTRESQSMAYRRIIEKLAEYLADGGR